MIALRSLPWKSCLSSTPPWHHVERGSGRPLVLLHGIGMSHDVWAPVLDALAMERRVIAFDLAGFGRSAPLPAGRTPTHENLLASMAHTLAEMGIDTPVDMAGNSLGGQLALVAARDGIARSVVALSPAGLWSGPKAPPAVRATLNVTRIALRGLPRFSERLMRSRAGRTLAFALPVTSRGWRIGADESVAIARTFRDAAAFDTTMEASQRFTGGGAITVPLTIAFGSRDWLLTANCQHRDQLPAHTRWLRPRGWGHVPMWDDPAGVARLILDGTAGS